MKKKIIFQANVYVGKDKKLLKLMQKAGVVGIFGGMESIDEASLKSVGKGFNKVKDYEECLKNLHKHGIAMQLG